MHANENQWNGLSWDVIGCAFTVLNTLGTGFLEKVHENARVHESRKKGLAVTREHGITVAYDGVM